MKTSRRAALALTVSAMLALSACGGGGTEKADAKKPAEDGKTYKIGITQIVSHPSLDQAADGFKQALEDAGLDVEYDEQNAQGDQGTATSIATRFAGQDLDLVLAVATPTAQAAAAAITDIPILFTAVTDPVAADLVASADEPGGNITGTTDMNPVADQIGLVKQVAPDAKTVGIIYSSGEVNSEVQVEMAKEAAAAEGLEIMTTTVTNSSEVLQGAQTLNVDAIYIPTDNIVVSAIDSVLQVAEERQIPVVAGESDSVKKGALITIGLDYFTLGEQTGRMAVRILTEGADPATMPVEEQEEPRLVINKGAAARMGVTLPQDLLDKADEIVE